ncbi:MAG: hypothetical protein MUC72_08765, partial [Acidobacteria bacterium]|nr:hypothetical protein [Acidobacteriota bacterium]
DDVWERQVFEKWAEEESRARLLNDLKNEGYLDARITSAVTTRGADKTIVFSRSSAPMTCCSTS